MDKQTFQTIEVAHALQVTGTTVRRYCQEFTEHLSEGTRRKRRAFTAGDIATLKRVQQLAGQGFTKAEINRLLFAPAEDEPQTTNAITAFPEVAQFIEQVRQSQTETQARIEALEHEVADLRAELAKPWYKRIFGK